MRKFVLAGLMAALGSVVAVAPALAWAEYCDWDPLVVIVTPAGNLVPVYDSVWTSTPMNIGLPVESYTATRDYDSDGNPVTAVDMSVYVPAGLISNFKLQAEVTTGVLGSGQMLGTTSGVSGQITHVRFTLPQS